MKKYLMLIIIILFVLLSCSKKKEKPFTCVSDYYDSNILSLLPDEELSALSLFMVNRVEKVKSKIVKTLCMITFLSNETKNNIDDEVANLAINEINM